MAAKNKAAQDAHSTQNAAQKQKAARFGTVCFRCRPELSVRIHALPV